MQCDNNRGHSSIVENQREFMQREGSEVDLIYDTAGFEKIATVQLDTIGS